MKLNCKPGDLARVIDDPDSRWCGLVDKVIRVASPRQWNGMTMWTYEGERFITPLGSVEAIADELLRPIHGGESTDESAAAMRDLYSIPSEVTA